MLDVFTKDEVKRKASALAQKYGWTLEPNPTTEEYADFLCGLVKQKPGSEKSLEFEYLARTVCVTGYGTGRPEVRKRIAGNVLSVAPLLSQDVFYVEENANLSRGALAKIKKGIGLGLTPLQVIYLSAELGVPIKVLVQNFDNNPEGLRKALIECEVIDSQDTVSVEAKSVVAEAAVVPASVEVDPIESSDHDVPAAEEVAPLPLVKKVDEDVPRPPVRSAAEIAANVRAAAKRAKVSLTVLLESISISNRRHLENIEKGDGAFSAAELATLAVTLGVDVSLFHTGKGLEKYRKRPQSDARDGALVIVGSKKLVLPPISAEKRADYFESRCLYDKVEVVEGRKIGELLAAARNRESTDWCTLWLDVTVEGAVYQKRVDTILAITKGWSDVLKEDFICRLHAAMWPGDVT